LLGSEMIWPVLVVCFWSRTVLHYRKSERMKNSELKEYTRILSAFEPVTAHNNFLPR
jgi:hypothetical protein